MTPLGLVLVALGKRPEDEHGFCTAVVVNMHSLCFVLHHSRLMLVALGEHPEDDRYHYATTAICLAK